jgi:hypothetical protein
MTRTGERDVPLPKRYAWSILATMRSLLVVALVGCAPAPTAPTPAAPPATPASSPAATATSPIRAGCVDVASDIAKRAPDAKPGSAAIDLDGDGVLDPVFTGYCSMMGGNCETYLYASNDGCPRYAGQVQVTRVTSGPTCADPPRGRAPCRLSASRMMIHGEIYEYFYVHGPGGYTEAGVGHRGERPRR